MVITEQKISIDDVEKLKNAYKELISANFNNASVQQMAPIVVAVGLLGDVIKALDENAPHLRGANVAIT